MEANIEANARLSILSFQRPSEDEIEEIKKGSPPGDSYFFVHILCLFLGVTSLLPVTFFITANSYWMYKFRDPSSNSTDPNLRTQLQKTYASSQMVAQAVPMMISSFISTRYGHKLKLGKRIRWCLVIILACFMVFTVFIKVNTDTWQIGFFILTISTLMLINAIYSLLQYSFILLIAKFPSRFMRLYMYGQGGAGVFGATLQIVSIAAGGDDVEAVALIYFVSGNLVIGSALAMLLVSNYMPFFQYYDSAVADNTKRDPHTWRELKPVIKQIRHCLAIIILVLCAIYMCHPTITSLVVSEFHGDGSAWSKYYFVPVITFLYGDVISLIGRFFATAAFAKYGLLWVILCALRTAIFVPLFLFCNAYPREHLSVVFSHDWQYAIIIGAYCFSMGFLFASLFLSVPHVVDKGQEEIGYALVQMAAGVGGSILSPLGLVIVNVL